MAVSLHDPKDESRRAVTRWWRVTQPTLVPHPKAHTTIITTATRTGRWPSETFSRAVTFPKGSRSFYSQQPFLHVKSKARTDSQGTSITDTMALASARKRLRFRLCDFNKLYDLLNKRVKEMFMRKLLF